MTPIPPSFSLLIKHPSCFFACGLGSGLIRPAPGSWGSLAALILFLIIAPLIPSFVLQNILLFIAFIAGIFICDRAERLLGIPDYSGIVWDEFVGMWLVLIWLPKLGGLQPMGSVVSYALAFVLFRLFDILKPFPIRFLDQHIHGGLGIMIDDLLAACYALIVLYLIQLMI